MFSWVKGNTGLETKITVERSKPKSDTENSPPIPTATNLSALHRNPAYKKNFLAELKAREEAYYAPKSIANVDEFTANLNRYITLLLTQVYYFLHDGEYEEAQEQLKCILTIKVLIPETIRKKLDFSLLFALLAQLEQLKSSGKIPSSDESSLHRIINLLRRNIEAEPVKISFEADITHPIIIEHINTRKQLKKLDREDLIIHSLCLSAKPIEEKNHPQNQEVLAYLYANLAMHFARCQLNHESYQFAAKASKIYASNISNAHNRNNFTKLSYLIACKLSPATIQVSDYLTIAHLSMITDKELSLNFSNLQKIDIINCYLNHIINLIDHLEFDKAEVLLNQYKCFMMNHHSGKDLLALITASGTAMNTSIQRYVLGLHTKENRQKILAFAQTIFLTLKATQSSTAVKVNTAPIITPKPLPEIKVTPVNDEEQKIKSTKATLFDRYDTMEQHTKDIKRLFQRISQHYIQQKKHYKTIELRNKIIKPSQELKAIKSKIYSLTSIADAESMNEKLDELTQQITQTKMELRDILAQIDKKNQPKSAESKQQDTPTLSKNQQKRLRAQKHHEELERKNEIEQARQAKLDFITSIVDNIKANALNIAIHNETVKSHEKNKSKLFPGLLFDTPLKHNPKHCSEMSDMERCDAVMNYTFKK